jgi:hypothetical protein
MSFLAILIRGRGHRRRVSTATAAVFLMSTIPSMSAVTAHVSVAHVLIHFHRRAAVRILSKNKTSKAEKS